MSSAPREYDPEIKDIADYVANKTIDSELAVSVLQIPRLRVCTPQYPALKLHLHHLNTRKSSRQLN
jgi:hypothetical protein